MGRTYLTAGSNLTEWRMAMRQIVDRATFNQIVATCFGIYEAVRAMNMADQEARQLESQADSLLKMAGSNFLSEALSEPLPNNGSLAEQFSEAYVQLQRARADLRQLVRNIAGKLVERGDTDSANRLADVIGLSEAEQCFKEDRYIDGRDLLRGFRVIPCVRVAYYRSFVDEMLKGSATAYGTLLAELPEAAGFTLHPQYLASSPPQAYFVSQFWTGLNVFLNSSSSRGKP